MSTYLGRMRRVRTHGVTMARRNAAMDQSTRQELAGRHGSKLAYP
jgi:hypothetical protein